ncbi:uncharacterized protein [Choristoneura fumiferana]|uniref:uncharacterized protein n=1 Tax=Choristoneura fumiferana TaxID=7141 RepID=UPI003D158B71
MSLDKVRVKEEMNWEEDMYDASEASAAAPSSLYDDHDIKPDLVLGPEVLQPQYIVDEDNFLKGLLKSGPVKKERIKQLYDKEVPLHGTGDKERMTCKTFSNQKTKTHSSKLKLLYVAHKLHHCKSCNKAFNNKSGLLNHSCILAENNNSSENEMDSDRSENRLKIHTEKMAFLHTCKICRRQFSASYYLKVHMKSHTKYKPVSCIHCKKQFKAKAALMSHVTHTHAEKKTYNCDHCERQFVAKASLKSHVANMHNVEKKKYTCDHCENNSQKGLV